MPVRTKEQIQTAIDRLERDQDRIDVELTALYDQRTEAPAEKLTANSIESHGKLILEVTGLRNLQIRAERKPSPNSGYVGSPNYRFTDGIQSSPWQLPSPVQTMFVGAFSEGEALRIRDFITAHYA